MSSHQGDVYSPITSIGLDTTTQRRLRIPSQMINQNHRLIDGESITISKEGLTFLEPFFSVREYAQIESLSIFPLIHARMIYAILICINRGQDAPVENSAIRKHISICQDTVYVEYFGRLSTLPRIPDEFYHSQLQAQIDNEVSLAVAQNSRLLCFSLKISLIVGDLTVFSSDINVLRIREDISRILHSFVIDGGFLSPGHGDTLLLCIRTRHITDPRFVLQHIETTLGDFFPNIQGIADTIGSSACYPVDVKDSASLLSKLGVVVGDA